MWQVSSQQGGRSTQNNSELSINSPHGNNSRTNGLIVIAAMEWMERYQTHFHVFDTVPFIPFQPLQWAPPPIYSPTSLLWFKLAPPPNMLRAFDWVSSDNCQMGRDGKCSFGIEPLLYLHGQYVYDCFPLVNVRLSWYLQIAIHTKKVCYRCTPKRTICKDKIHSPFQAWVPLHGVM